MLTVDDPPVDDPTTDDTTTDSNTVKGSILATQTMTAIAYAMNIASSSISLTSPQSLWLIIGQFQLLMLLLISEAFIPRDIADYIMGMDYTMFSFGFINVKDWQLISNPIKHLSYPQSSYSLYFIGLESGSGLVNILSLLFTILLITLLHLLILVLYRL